MRALLPWLALGPVTGPLAYGCAEALRARRWPMAAVYALGLAEFWIGAPALLNTLARLAHG